MNTVSTPVVLVDTREQMPFEFSGGVCAVRRKLDTGDYSLEGMEVDGVAIERKSLDDLVKTLIHAKQRFAAELTRMQAFNVRAVVVEASVEDVMAHRYRADVHPRSVLALCNAAFVRYRVPVFFWGARPHCRYLLENLLTRIWLGAGR